MALFIKLHVTVYSFFINTIDGENNHSKKKLKTEAPPCGFTPNAGTERTGQRLKEFRSIKHILEGTIVLKAYS